MQKLLNILKYVLFLGLGIFLVWWSLKQIPANRWNEFKAAFATARYWLIIPVFFILSASHFLRAVRWKMLMKPLDHHPSLPNTFFAVMIGYLANLAVPRLGEVLKCTVLAKYEKVPVQKLMGTILAERAFDVVCLAGMFVLALIFQSDVIGEYGRHLSQKMFGDKAGHFSPTKIIVFIAAAAIIILVFRFVLRRFLHIKLIHSIVKFVEGIGLGIISIRYMKQRWQFILASLAIWMLYLLGTWVGFYATAGTEGLSLKIALSSLAFASIGMILTPGGIGAYALLLAGVLQRNGIPFEIGFANGTLQWFAQFIIVLFVGFISMGLLPWYNKKTRQHEAASNYSVENLQP